MRNPRTERRVVLYCSALCLPRGRCVRAKYALRSSLLHSGIDDYVFIEEPEGWARLRKVTGTSSTPAGMLPVIVAPNQCEVSIPLSLLGDFDGRFDFQVRALLRSPRTIQDVLPDVGFAHVQ